MAKSSGMLVGLAVLAGFAALALSKKPDVAGKGGSALPGGPGTGLGGFLGSPTPAPTSAPGSVPASLIDAASRLDLGFANTFQGNGSNAGAFNGLIKLRPEVPSGQGPLTYHPDHPAAQTSPRSSLSDFGSSPDAWNDAQRTVYNTYLAAGMDQQRAAGLVNSMGAKGTLSPAEQAQFDRIMKLNWFVHEDVVGTSIYQAPNDPAVEPTARYVWILDTVLSTAKDVALLPPSRQAIFYSALNSQDYRDPYALTAAYQVATV